MKIFGTILSILLLPSLLMAQLGGNAGMGGKAGTGGGPTIPTIALVSTGTGYEAGTNTVVTTGTGTGSTAFSCTGGTGNTEVLGFIASTNVTGTAADSASNSGWVSYSATPYNSQSGYYETWFYNYNIASSVTSAHVTFTSTNMIAMVAAHCISGLTHGADFTQVNSSNAGGATFTSGTFTTGHANEIVLTLEANGGPYALSSATTPAVIGVNYLRGSTSVISSAYAIYSSIQTSQTFTATLTTAASTDQITAGFY